MPTPVRLKDAAVEDLTEIYAWYERQRSGLGEELLAAVRNSLDSIGRHPLANAVVRRDYRRALVKRFPYSIFYKVTEHEIIVRAVMHNSRNPETWKGRLRGED